MTIRRFVFVALLANLLATANADDRAMARCAAVASPLDRLECYDALARTMRVAPTPAPAPVAAVPPVAAPIPGRDAPTAVATAPSREPLPTSAPTPDATIEDQQDFGFEAKRIEEEPEEFSARYDGDFSGWSGRTLFKLENGQVWKQTQSGRVSHRRSRPMITIRRGAFGSFRLSVEGLNRTIRVKRVK